MSVDTCPHCGTKSGYSTRIVLKAERLYSWSGTDIDTENYVLASETQPRCMDCGKSVSKVLATPPQGTAS